jgi:hypothetical protein
MSFLLSPDFVCLSSASNPFFYLIEVEELAELKYTHWLAPLIDFRNLSE